MPSSRKQPNGGRTARRITLVDVASDADVSRATASLVMRGSPLISEETTEKVLHSMEKLGYVYNRAAASLRAEKSHAVGLAVTDITNPFFAELAVGIERRLDEARYTLLLTHSGERRKRQQALLSMMHGYQIDGLLLCPARGTIARDLALLKRWGLPTVLIARDVPNSSLEYVGADNFLGAKQAVQHLLARGHRRIAFAGGPSQSTARVDRLAGYSEAIKKAGIPIDDTVCRTSEVTREGGHKAILDLLQLEDPPTAALCYNDVVAFGAMLGLEASGKQPGVDFAVVGFDNISDSALWHPALTTVSITPEQIAEAATARLIERISRPDAPATKTIIPPSLIVRESS